MSARMGCRAPTGRCTSASPKRADVLLLSRRIARCGHSREPQGASRPARGARPRRDRAHARSLLLSRPRHLREGRGLLDRFDQVFAKVFKGIAINYGIAPADIPEEWLKAIAEKFLTPEEMEAIKSLGSWEEIMETLKQRLDEQKGRHQGGSSGSAPAAPRPSALAATIPRASASARRQPHRRAVKVWDKREFKNFDIHQVELGTRNIKVALRRLRRFAREGAADELDLDATIDGTAKHGYLDVKHAARAPQRRQAVALPRRRRLDGPVRQALRGAVLGRDLRVQASRIFYFHNCLYEGVWKDNRRRFTERHADLGRAPQIRPRL
jgi:uncharacterized protein with von Willebrand factor type A (vWA) domain